MNISIDLPNINEQRLILLQQGSEDGCRQLRANLDAPRYPAASGINADDYGDKHLRTADEGSPGPGTGVSLVRSVYGSVPGIRI